MAFWIPLAGLGVGVASAIAKNNREKKLEEESRMMRASEIRNAPWTGRQSFTNVAPAGSQFANLLAGGMSGLTTGLSAGKALDTGKLGQLFGAGKQQADAPAMGPETEGSYWKRMAMEQAERAQLDEANMNQNQSSLDDELDQFGLGKRRASTPATFFRS